MHTHVHSYVYKLVWLGHLQFVETVRSCQLDARVRCGRTWTEGEVLSVASGAYMGHCAQQASSTVPAAPGAGRHIS